MKVPGFAKAAWERLLRAPSTPGVLALCVLAAGSPAQTTPGGTAPPEITGAEPETQESSPDPAPLEDLEALLDAEITGVSRRAQKVSDTAAAAFVVTDEDIRRLGAQHVADALRIVPGLHIAQITRHRWAVSSRGLGGEFTNNLLVLMDGRTIYTPLFAGTHWDVQDTLLEDISRIEVIRGPGATLWGSNAVNGIISIVTKTAFETQGLLLEGGYGTEDNGWGQMRYGAALGEDAAFRIYGKWFDRDGLRDSTGREAHDDWDTLRGGFRVDWNLDGNDRLTFQGDIYRGHAEQVLRTPSSLPPFVIPSMDSIRFRGANLLARWTHEFSSTSDLTFQTYFDYTDRDSDLHDERRRTLDFDFTHRAELGNHELIWGLGYRVSWDDTAERVFAFVPDDRSLQLFSGFVQDSIRLLDDVVVTVGVKLEHNDFSGLEVQPSARVLWNPAVGHAIWAAASRAVRTPARADRSSVGPVGAVPPFGMMPGVLITTQGSSDFDVEKMLSFELGYRGQVTETLTVDFAAFFSRYDDLRGFRGGAITPILQPGPPFVTSPLVFDNSVEAHTYGAELAVTWRPFPNWRLGAGYTFTQVHTSDDVAMQAGHTPHHQFNLRSYWDVTDRLELNSALYYVDNLRSLGVPSYVRWDLQVAWRPVDEATLTLGVQNILDDRHPEYGAQLQGVSGVRIEAERMGYFSIELRF